MPTPGPIAMLAAMLLGGPSGDVPPPELPAPPRPVALAVAVRSGLASFEIPEDLAGGEVLLIVSAMATEGPYAVQCVATSGEGGPRPPDLREVGSAVSLARPMRAPSGSGVEEDAEVGRGRPDSAPRGPTARPPLRRSFAVLARPGDPASPSQYDLVDARLRAVGEGIQVFVDEDDVAAVEDDVLRAIVSAFDREIRPRLEPRIGAPLDVDRDGRFTVLLSRRVGLPFPGRSHVDGYFRSADLDEELPRPLSNRADMIYLNASLPAGPYLETVLAHEYAHALIDSARRRHSGPLAEESWLDEAMAHLCEEYAGRSAMNLDYRVSAFLAEPNRYRLIVDDEHRPGLFRSHGNRGAAYLFLRWCAGAFDAQLPRTLAIQGRSGPGNLERATGLPFEDLHRRWTIDLALASLGAPDGTGVGLDLLDAIGDWPLGGVRFAEFGPGLPPVRAALEGTSSLYLRLGARPSGPTAVEVRCDPAADARVTAILLPDRLPRLSLDLAIVEEGPDAARVVATIEERSGVPAVIDRLAWEALVPAPDRGRSELRSHLLQGDELRSFLDGPTLAAGALRRTAPLPIPLDVLRDGPTVFRLSARSLDGARIVAWAELPAPRPLPSRPTRPASLERPAPPAAPSRIGPTP